MLQSLLAKLAQKIAPHRTAWDRAVRLVQHTTRPARHEARRRLSYAWASTYNRVHHRWHIFSQTPRGKKVKKLLEKLPFVTPQKRAFIHQHPQLVSVGTGLALAVLVLSGLYYRWWYSPSPRFKPNFFNPGTFSGQNPTSPLVANIAKTKTGAQVQILNGNSGIEFITPIIKAEMKIAQDKAIFKDKNQAQEVRYQLIDKGIKEEIILHTDPQTNTFTSGLQTKDATPALTADQQIIFLNDQNEYVFHLEKPWAKDANGDITYAVSYKLVPKEKPGLFNLNKQTEQNTALSPLGQLNASTVDLMGGVSQLASPTSAAITPDGAYDLVMEIDPRWMSAPERVYPITIDPTVIYEVSSEYASGEYNRAYDAGYNRTPDSNNNNRELSADTNTIGLWHLNEIGAATHIDSSGNGNTGTSSNATVVDAQINKGLSFNGSSTIVSVADSTSLDSITNNMTIEMWINPGSTQNAFSTIMSKHSTGTGVFSLEQNNTSTNVYNMWFSGNTCTDILTLTANKWQHIAVVKNGTSVNSYIDGHFHRSCTLASSTITPNNDLLYFGRWSSGGGRFFTGRMDEIRLSNSARTQIEIKEAAQKGPSIESFYQELPADEHTLGLWHMNEGTDNTCSGGQDLCDVSGNSLHATFNGNAAFTTNGRLGTYGMNLDGNADYAEFPDSSLLDLGTSDFTLETWAYANSFTTNNTYMELGSWPSAMIFRQDSASVLGFYTMSGSYTFSYSPPTKQWYHVALVRNKGVLTLYADGKFVGNQLSDATITVAGVNRFGSSVHTTAQYFNGSLDEIRISGVARSADEIKLNAQRRPYAIYTSPVIDLTQNLDDGSKGELLMDNTSLVAQWNFNETSGTNVNSLAGSCGNNCNGTLYNAADTSGQDKVVGSGWTNTNKKWGQSSLMLDGSNDYVSMGVNSNLNFTTQNFTMEGWFKFDSLASTQVLMGNGTGNQNGYFLYWESSSGTLSFATAQSGTTQVSFSTASPITTGQWYHLAVSRNGSTGKIYVNGTDVTSFSGNHINPTSSTYPFAIGVSSFNLITFPMDGAVDSVRVYTRVLSASELLTNYQANANRNIVDWGGNGESLNSTTGLVAQWDFNETSGTTASVTAGSCGVSCNATLTSFANTSGQDVVANSGWTATNKRWGTGAVMLDGSDDYLTDASPGTLPTGATARTIEMWVKPSNLSTGGALFHYGNGATAGQEFILQFTNLSGDLYLFTDGTNAANNIAVQPSEAPAIGEWNHVVFTLDGANNWVYYLNGVRRLSGTFSVAINTVTPTVMNIGDRTDVANTNFPGVIDSTRVYSRALTPAEIIENYKVSELAWLERGVATGDGETPANSSGLTAEWYFNQTSGTTANAGGSCGATCNGTLTNFASTGSQDAAAGTGWTAANRRWGAGAIAFDGTDDYVSVPDSSVYETSTGSIELWFKTSTSQGPRYIFSKSQTVNQAFNFYQDTSNRLAFWIRNTAGTSSITITSQNAIHDGEWHHAVGIWGSSGMRLYLDGKLQSSNTYTGWWDGTTAALQFGREATTPGFYWKGSMDAVRMYSRVLTPEEILSNYNAGNIELQTRTSSDGSTWGAWSPVSSETAIESFDTNTSVATPSAQTNLTWYKYDNTLPPQTSDSDSTNGRIFLGSAGRGDASGTLVPRVIYDGGVYKMWYAALSGSGWMGYHATSPDGLTWTKYDNVIPTTSNTTGTGGRLPLGVGGTGDDGGVYPGPVIKDGNEYKMWYQGDDGANSRGYMATSTDGINWNKVNNGIPGTSNTTGSNGQLPLGASNGDITHTVPGSVIKEGSTLRMWYSGYNAAWRIFYAESTDGGYTWTKQGNTAAGTCDTVCTEGAGRLGLGTSGKGDDNGVYAPMVIKDGSTYKMWYAGHDGSTGWRIFYATSPDGLIWTKYDNNLPGRSDSMGTNGRIGHGNTGKSDNGTELYGISVVDTGTQLKAWYHTYYSDGVSVNTHYINHAYMDKANSPTITKADSSAIKMEGSNALKLNTATPQIDSSTVGYWSFDETGGTGAYLRDQSYTAPATPDVGDGADGAITVSANRNINTDNMISGRSCADGGDAVNYSSTVNTATGSASITLSSTPSTGCLAVGDEVLIINQQLIGSPIDYDQVGQWETKTIQSISTNTLNFATGLSNEYRGATQRIMVQRVPNYTNVTINSTFTLTANAWNGVKGGVLFFRANGTVSNSGTIDMNGKGYRGAPRRQVGVDYTYGWMGESEAVGYQAIAQAASIASGGGGGNGQGGGAGGSYGTLGVDGVAAGCTVGAPFTTGRIKGDAALTKLHFGGSGGAAGSHNGGGRDGAIGGASGGILGIAATTLTNSGTIRANGSAGENGYFAAGANQPMGGGGGGAGGSVLIQTTTLTTGTITASGGAGGSASATGAGCTPSGAGGAGGQGRIKVDTTSALGGTTTHPLTSSSPDHATPTGTTVVDGVVGKARSFNGTSDYLEIPDSGQIRVGEPHFTFEGWINPSSYSGCGTDGSGATCMIANKENVYEFAMASNGNVNWAINNTSPGWAWISTGANLPLNTWTHIAIVYDGQFVYTYKNGQQVHMNAASGVINHQTARAALRIGARNAPLAANSFFPGKMDEISLSSRAKTKEEIDMSYRLGANQTVTKTISTTDLSGKTQLPFYVAADRPGTYLQPTLGENSYVNYDPDSTTIAHWKFEENLNSWGDYFFGTTLDSSKWIEIDPGGKLAQSNGMILSAGSTGANWDAGLISKQKFTRDQTTVLYARFITGSTVASPNHMMIGFAQDQTASGAFGTISHALYFNAGTFYMFQDGANVGGPLGSGYVANTLYEISVQLNSNGTATYYVKGGVYTNWTALGTDTAKTNSPLRVQISNYQHTGYFSEIAVGVPDRLVTDSSGYDNHGQVYNAKTFPGKLGSGRNFNGMDSFIWVPPSNIRYNFFQSDPFTIEAWVRPTAVSSTDRYIFNKQQNVTNEFVFALNLTSGNKFNLALSKQNISGQNITGTSTPVAGQWYHVVGVSNGTTASLYVNGQLEASSAISITSTTQSKADIQIGRLYTGANYFAGEMDEIRISNIARTADEIRQAYEVGKRSYPITIDFTADLDSGNLITNSGDTSFTVDGTAWGMGSKGNNLYVGEKVIIKENYDGTEYIAQGIVTTVNASTGAVNVSSWDAGSTFPSGGFTTNAIVFKWQREYWDITGAFDSHLNATTDLSLRVTNGLEGRTIWIDDLKSNAGYMSTATGTDVTSSPNRYIQYRAIISSSDTNVSPAMRTVAMTYEENVAPNTPTLDSPANAATGVTTSPTLQTTATDTESDYLRYKIELCTDLAMTTGCQTFDQTSSQTGWSGQNAQTSTAYNSGSQASYTLQTPLTSNTTYYWRSYAIDPGGRYAWSSTQGTPYSFTTNKAPNVPTLDAPTDTATNQLLLPLLHTTATDDNSDYLRYKIELCTNVGMTTSCQTFDQTSSQTGWSGQNAQTSTAYTSGTQATYTIQSALSPNTTYYWRSYAIDPGGSNSWGATQGTPYSFTTSAVPTAPNLLEAEATTNPTGVTDITPEFTAIYNDPNSGDLANKYQIQVATAADFSGTLMWDSGSVSMSNLTQGTRSTAVSYAGTALTYNGATYYWRIRFTDVAGNVGAWSNETATFTMYNLLTPSSCTLAKTIPNTQITVSWNDPNSGEDGYEVQKSLNGGAFGALTTTAANATSYPDNTTSDGNTYQYRVRATMNSQTSNWCTTATLSLDTDYLRLEGVKLDGLQLN